MKTPFFLLIICLISCKNIAPSVEYGTTYYTKQNKEIENKILNNHHVQEKEFSLLIFTYGFTNQDIKIINYSDIIYDGNLKSDPSMGFSKIFRINNNYDTKIIEKNSEYSFVLKKRNTKKYKYIYIGRSPRNKKKYSISYSNEMKTFR